MCRGGALIAPAALVAVVTASSCRDVIGQDELDVSAALCDTLTDCYQDAAQCDIIESRMRDSSNSQVGLFLDNFDTSECLDTCAGAKGCMDDALFCGAPSATCGPGGACCGATAGLSECGVDEICCSRRGAQCMVPSDCCDDSLGCDNGFCGGVACTQVGDGCRFPIDCCSGRCVEDEGGEKRCAALDCTPEGQPCVATGECCPVVDPNVSLVCLPVNDGTSRCTLVGETCGEQGQACDLAGGTAPCCEGFRCEIAIATLEGACVPDVVGGCKVEGFDCADDSDCCDPLICALDIAQSICVTSPGCGKAGDACQGGDECCSGTCFGNECQQGTGGVVCAIPENVPCHSPRTVGPILPDTGECADPCVDIVRMEDSFCACTFWDTVCVDAFVDCAR